MNEEQSKKALFELNRIYMSNPPKKRSKLYNKYIQDRNLIKEALIKSIEEKKRDKSL